MAACQAPASGWARESGKRKYKALYLDCAPQNRIARHVYDKLGFQPTGDVNHGDIEMRLELNEICVR